VKLEPYLDLVATWPVIELIEPEPADPGAGGLLDGRPWAEPVHTPLSQAAFGESGDSLGRQVSTTPDSRIAQEALKFHAIFFAPGTQAKPIRLNRCHVPCIA